MPFTLLSSAATVQVFSPTLVSDALICTFVSSPSGSTLIRTVPQASFNADQGHGLLASLSDAVESILGDGIAIDATGTQGVDPAGLLYDSVVFTVAYVPPSPVPGTITSTVEIPVNIITADTSFGGSFGGVQGLTTAPEIILAEYDRLRALAGQ